MPLTQTLGTSVHFNKFYSILFYDRAEAIIEFFANRNNIKEIQGTGEIELHPCSEQAVIANGGTGVTKSPGNSGRYKQLGQIPRGRDGNIGNFIGFIHET